MHPVKGANSSGCGYVDNSGLAAYGIFSAAFKSNHQFFFFIIMSKNGIV
jgi:hypothetical protein